MKNIIKTYAVRRFTEWRDDHRCFELYTIADGKCASFPGTRKELEIYAKQRNEDEVKPVAILPNEGNEQTKGPE